MSGPELPEFFNIGQVCTRPPISGFSQETLALVVDHTAEGETDTAETLSYAQLDAQSNQLAAVLSSLGGAKGDRVLLWLPNCMAFPVSFFGALKQGLIAVPASMLLAGEELDFLAQDSGARILITTAALWSKLSTLPSTQHALEHVILVADSEGAATLESAVVHRFEQLMSEQVEASAPDIQTRADDPAYLVYTSGTTGFPKGVLHAHRALLGRLPASQYWFDYQESGDRILHSGKFNWTYVLGTALMDPLYLGKTVVVYEGEAASDVWPALIAKHECSIFIGVPTVYRQILQKTSFTAEQVPSLRYCMSAGEHLSDEVLSLWQSRFGLAIYEAVGMSECSYYLSQYPGKPIRPGSAGFIQLGHQVDLLNEEFAAVNDEEEGMLCISERDPGLFLEYWRRPEETAATRRQGYFLTGDYARRDRDGYIWFHGRKDDLINSFGYRISPYEIERVLKGHPHVSDCVVLGQTLSADKVLVAACVVLMPGMSVSPESIKTYAAEHLASYKIPKVVHFMDNFPRTANGKVMRKQLRASLPAPRG